MMKVPYTKPALSFVDQIERLKSRGLVIDDEHYAEQCLSNISYYRLRAYTYPFQEKEYPHNFLTLIRFDEVVELYNFDRKLRLLVLNAIEKIEVALRTQIIYQWAMIHGSHWYSEVDLCRDTIRHADHMELLKKEIERSTEDFIDHYRKKYDTPPLPPSWMSLEITSYGLLSKIFQNLSKGDEKLAVANSFGLNANVALLEGWMYCFSAIRNICAHHARLWNRRLSPILLPKRLPNPFVVNRSMYPNKLYAALCCMQYMLQSISPCCGFKNALKELMAACPLDQERAMGFLPGWEHDPFWN